MYSVAEIKPGKVILINGDPYICTKSEFGKQARQAANNKCTLKNLKTGATIQQTFAGNDKMEPADISRAKCQYLYEDGTNCHFMHSETYQQFELSKEELGDALFFLVEGEDVSALFFEGNPIGIDVAPKVTLKVKETIPGVKGDTASGGSKPATLETGLTVNVPLFIKEGDSIVVNTENKTYVERA